MCSRIKLSQRLCKNTHKWQLFEGDCVGQIKVMVDVVDAVSVQLVRNAWQGSLNLKACRTLSTCTDITEREGRQLGQVFWDIRCFLLQTQCLNFCTDLLDVLIGERGAKLCQFSSFFLSLSLVCRDKLNLSCVLAVADELQQQLLKALLSCKFFDVRNGVLVADIVQRTCVVIEPA